MVVVHCAPATGLPSRAEELRVLILLTGSGNERQARCPAYNYVALVNWDATHARNATWLPSVLDQLLRKVHALGAPGLPVVVDVLGLSRGGAALMFCCSSEAHPFNV